MSLADQSQQWYPTSVQVTVFQARNLKTKGKNGTNDAYAIMQLAKDKFSTSVAEKCVAPIWKEEATFDLPLFHNGNADRCTLYIIVMHRALVGLDKLLGQAVINLLDLHDNKSRKKSEWFKLLDKNGKADKDRGEVLLDIQFMRNNMTASMFDLSMKDKPRSRLGKLKDKVRGKKSDGFSDSASAIVPSVSQVLTDSDGEGDAHSESPATKKKSKLKSLFAPKSNLHRNHSQSMSVLGTLPEKNSPLSGSRSSGLNVESPDVKRKIGLGKFGLGHKRTGSNDSKASQGPFSLLGRSKQSAADQNTTCINGSHVYAEEHERKTGSTLSLSSSGKGSVEDVRRQHERNFSDASTDSFKALTIPSYKPETQERKTSVPQRLTEEEEEKELDAKSQAEEKLRQAEEKRRQAEGKRIQEMLERQEDQEKKRMLERQKKVEEEEKKRKREEEERKEQQRLRQEEAKQAEEQERRRQEEARRAEEQKRHEETRVTDRLSSLFGLGRKKEEKKEEQHQENQPVAAPRRSFKELEVPASSNPFEEVSLSPDPAATVQGPTETQRAVLNPHVPSSGFPSRTAKVSAVKPRLAEWQNPETDLSNPPSPTNTTDTQSQEQDQVSPSSLLSGSSSSSSVPSDSVDMYRYYSSHSSVAPANASPGVNDEPRPDQMANEQRVGQKQAQMPALPLPDYETLFPKKRHGVMGQNRWDNIIAEVNQRRLERETDMSGPEMSVDGPSEEPPVVPETAVRQERSTASMSQSSWRQVEMHREIPEARTVSGARQALQPPKPTAAATPRPQAERETVVAKPRHSQGNERIRIEHELHKEPPVPASRASQIQNHSDRSSTDVSQADRQIPSVKPRQKTPMKEPTEHLQPEATQDKNMDPFPNSSVQLRDPWNTPQPNKDQDDLFSGGTKKEVKPEERGLTADDLDQIFESARPSDPFPNLSQNGSARSTEQNKPTKAIPKEVRASPESSQKKRQAPKPPTSLSDTRNMFMDRVGRHSGRRQYDTRKSKPDVKTQDAVLSEKPISTGPEEEPVSTSSGPPESSTTGAGDFATHPVGLKTPARAWVSPSDVQPVATQSSGGGPSATLRSTCSEGQYRSSLATQKVWQAVQHHQLVSMENSGLKPNERSTVERPVLPIPDYETLFPKKRHGVMGQTRWDNIIAEVNHRRMNKSLNCSEAATSASGLDESKVTCPPPVSHQSTLALQETLGESSDKNTGPSSKKALQPLKPILSDRNVDVSTKQAHLPPKPVFPDKVVGTSSEQALQSPKPVSPWQTVEVTPMTRNVPVTPIVAKSFKAPNTVLMSALENIQKRDSRYKKTEQKGNDKKAFGSVSDRLKKKPVSTSTVLSDTSPTGVIKTERDAQLGPLVNSKPVMPIQNTQASNTDMSFKDDPFPGDQLLSHDPWQLPQKNMSGEMFLMKEDEKTYLSERHDDFVKTFASDPQINPFSHDSKSDLTGPSKHNEPVEIISPTPQISPKKRRAPLPPMTSSSIDSKAKLERHTRESCRESDIKTNDILENSISSIISEEQGNAEDMDISSVTEPASTKTDFVESSSKQQVEFMGKPKHSQTSSSAEKHPQANSKRLMSALENAQKRNLTVIKPAATERVLDTKSANLVEQNKSTEVISKVVTPTPQVTPKKRLAPLPPVTSSHSRIKTKPENCLELSDVTTKDDLLLDNSNSPTSNEEQKNARQIDISSDSMETDTKTTTAATSKQQVEAEHSQTSQPQPDEPGGTQQEKDVHQTAMTPATEILTLKEDNQTDFIDVETADTQDPFPSDAIPDKGPWNIPEPSTHDDCLITDETETKKTEVVDGCLNLDIKADSFSDNRSEIVSEQNKAMPIIDSGTPVHQNLSKKPISSSPVSSMCTGNSEIDSDEQMSEPNHTLHPIPLNATVVVTPNEEPMNTEPLDTSLPIQPEAFLTEEAEAIGITPNHKEMVMKPADETLKEMEVIPIIDSQHVTICQIVSLENAPDVDTENIEYDPSPSGAVLSNDPGNLLHDENDNDNVAHSTKEKINVEETGLSPNELDRNCETDIPTDLPSVSSHSDFIMYSEQKTVEIIPDNGLSTPMLSKQHQDPLHHGSPSTLYVFKPDTPETSSDVSRQITDPGKEENASLAIATTSVKDTPIDISQIQQDKMYPIPNRTKSSPPVDHLSHMNVHVTESMSKTNSEKYSRGPIPHALKLKTFSPSPSFSSPTMTPSDAHWDSDSEESLICVSTNTARSPHQNRYDNYISSTISLSPKVPELHLASTGEGSSSKPTPEDTGKSLQWEPSAGILDAVLGEDTTVVRPKESIFSPLSAGAKPPVYAWISPLGVQAGVPDGIGLELASSPLRPHPVKPLSAQESQHPGSSSVAVSKDLKSISITDMPEKLKRTGSGPYTQLTQEELITLVVKQQTELTKRDEKIVELEEYIDNLLVRVIEEQPSILMSLAAAKGSH